jgi:hypothetical protein
MYRSIKTDTPPHLSALFEIKKAAPWIYDTAPYLVGIVVIFIFLHQV